jgi:hypothetical protein
VVGTLAGLALLAAGCGSNGSDPAPAPRRRPSHPPRPPA